MKKNNMSGLPAAEKPTMGPKILVVQHSFPVHGGGRLDKFVKFLPSFGIEPITLSTKFGKKSQSDDIYSSIFPPWMDTYQVPKIDLAYFASRFLVRGPTAKHYKLLKFLSFPERCVLVPDRMVPWIPQGIRLAKRILERRNVSAVLTSSPYESTHLIGLNLKRRFGLPWIADFRDLWTEKELAYRPATPLHDWWIRRLERTIMAEADHIIANTIENMEYYLREFHLPKQKVSVITNGFDRQDLNSTDARKEKNKAFLVGHMGYLDKTAYPWKLFLGGLKKLADEVGEDKVRFVHCGFYSREVKAYVQQNGMEALIVAEGHLPHGEAMRRVATTDVQLVLLYETADSHSLAPQKLYNYLIMKGPILAIAPEKGAVARVVTETKTGDVISPKRSPDAVFRVLHKYYNDWERGDQTVEPDQRQIARYDRETLTEELSAILLDRISRA